MNELLSYISMSLVVINRQPVFATYVALQNSMSYHNLTYGNHRTLVEKISSIPVCKAH
jgi:hypothetical protein